MLKVINHRNYLNMFKKLLRRLFHIAFLFKRPLTVGMRAICYEAETNSVLLVQHMYTDDWSLPGGGIETGESFDTALVRELLEEAGLICKDYQIIDIYHNNSISKRDHVVICLVNKWTEEIDHTRPKFEIMKTDWYQIDDLPNNITPCTLYALKKCNHIFSKS